MVVYVARSRRRLWTDAPTSTAGVFHVDRSCPALRSPKTYESGIVELDRADGYDHYRPCRRCVAAGSPAASV